MFDEAACCNHHLLLLTVCEYSEVVHPDNQSVVPVRGRYTSAEEEEASNILLK